MGTRADFYVKRQGESLAPVDWVGSIAWDGYPEGIPDRVLNAESLHEFIMAIAENAEEDFTPCVKGWPWPWENSCTTDYAYVFWVEEGKVIAYNWGERFNPEDEEDECYDKEHALKFPDMDMSKTAPIGSPASGIMVIGRREVPE